MLIPIGIAISQEVSKKKKSKVTPVSLAEQAKAFEILRSQTAKENASVAKSNKELRDRMKNVVFEEAPRGAVVPNPTFEETFKPTSYQQTLPWGDFLSGVGIFKPIPEQQKIFDLDTQVKSTPQSPKLQIKNGVPVKRFMTKYGSFGLELTPEEVKVFSSTDVYARQQLTKQIVDDIEKVLQKMKGLNPNTRHLKCITLIQ